MILDFKPESLPDWSPVGRCQTLKFNGCFITVELNKARAVSDGLCYLKKTTATGKTNYFGPFNYRNDSFSADLLWKIKALMTALQDDELNKRHLATLVVMRMQHAG